MNAVIYARYSSAGQTEQSIEGQLRVCHEFAEKKGYVILNEYIDRAISGTSDQRPAFLQMIEDAKKKEFSYVIVYKLDRFSRNKYDSVMYKHRLSMLDVKVISATEAISDSPEGRLVEGLLEMMAEMYSQDLSQKVKRGMKESLLKKNFIGGRIPFGYKVENNKLVIDSEKAPIIKYYFEQYAMGKPKSEIVKELNSMGCRNYYGKPFTMSSLQHCLSNLKYTGTYEVNGMRIENYCPKLIDVEVFNKVQKMLDKNKHYGAARKAKEEYLLTGKLFCGMCNGKMVGMSGRARNGQVFHYYACQEKIKNHSCIKKYEKKEELEYKIVDLTITHLLESKKKKSIIDKIFNALQNDYNNIKISEYEKKITDVESKLDKCFDMLCDSNSDEIKLRAKNKVQELEILKKDLVRELSKLKLANKNLKSKEDIEKYLDSFLSGDRESISFRKRIIDNLISIVLVFDDQYAIYYNLYSDKNLASFNFEKDFSDVSKEVLISNRSLRQELWYKNQCFYIFKPTRFGIIVKR